MKKQNYMDHFNVASDNYRLYRPTYPDALFEFILSYVKERNFAWDVGTGNGQAALKLASYFKKVYATDLNANQIQAATQKENIEYVCSQAEKATLPNASVDLVTVAQALHWFKFEQFYPEVQRVLKPAGIMAAWCYSLCKFNQLAIDEVISKLYYDLLGNIYWPPERTYIDKAYTTIPFPFQKITTPEFSTSKQYNLYEMIGYLNTWSAVKEYTQRELVNPIDLVFPQLKAAWGDPNTRYSVTWPIHLLLGS